MSAPELRAPSRQRWRRFRWCGESVSDHFQAGRPSLAPAPLQDQRVKKRLVAVAAANSLGSTLEIGRRHVAARHRSPPVTASSVASGTDSSPGSLHSAETCDTAGMPDSPAVVTRRRFRTVAAILGFPANDSTKPRLGTGIAEAIPWRLSPQLFREVRRAGDHFHRGPTPWRSGVKARCSRVLNSRKSGHFSVGKNENPGLRMTVEFSALIGRQGWTSLTVVCLSGLPNPRRTDACQKSVHPMRKPICRNFCDEFSRANDSSLPGTVVRWLNSSRFGSATATEFAPRLTGWRRFRGPTAYECCPSAN